MKKILQKRDGFTLIELLAVIVILAVIMLVASTSVSGVMKNAKQGTFRNEFLSLLESAQIQASIDQMNGNYFSGNNGEHCYKVSEITQFSKSGTYKGSVLVKKENGAFTYTGWMSNGEFLISGKTSSLQVNSDNITDSNADASEKCGA